MIEERNRVSEHRGGRDDQDPPDRQERRTRGGSGPRRDDRQARGGRTEGTGRSGRGDRRSRDDRRNREERWGRDGRGSREDRVRHRDGGEDRPRYRGGREDRPDRVREPELPPDADAGGLDRSLRQELRTLSKDNAEAVGGHLVMVGRALDAEDFDLALAHAEAASRRAGRVAGVRETLGVVYYRRGDWAKALAEFRTARRLSGTHHLLPLMADTERGLGRPERALELAAVPEAASLRPEERVELAIVVSGARADMGQTAAAVLHLRDLVRAGSGKEPWAARLRYAYAAALEADGRTEDAREWYQRAAAVDAAEETDAAELLGVVEPWVVDLGAGDEAEEGDEQDGSRRDEQAPQDRRDPAQPGQDDA